MSWRPLATWQHKTAAILVIFSSLPIKPHVSHLHLLPIIMSASPVLDSAQSNQSPQVCRADRNESMIRSWGPTELLKWIQQKVPLMCTSVNQDKFLAAEISGSVFMASAGSEDFYTRPSIGLSFGASFQLAELAREIIDRESKFHFQSGTPPGLPCYKVTHASE